MLLRRVIEHVNAQNWTAVVLDFVIVVLAAPYLVEQNAIGQRAIATIDAELGALVPD